ncbi:hypothetical protein HAX54_001766 [Datura stramonium]|uniref:Uncharacterized protein n=1 Tax=Datura stramonium TaxID=4076 RepID=A0ABS8T2U5_DATST|nr:hypothetical protein [Datura stramonium]
MGGHGRSGVRADWSDDDYFTYYFSISRLSRNGLGWNRKNMAPSCLQGRFFGGDRLVKKQAYPRPDRQLLGFPISSNFPVFGQAVAPYGEGALLFARS